jgi:ABC-type transporter Mla MlaB component
MATKDTNLGLLSKVAKFVRNPTTNWSDLDRQDAAPDSGYSKLALKEMIERKRQNDFVRRREFDYLRKIRRNGLTISTETAGRPSYFQSSTPSSLDERATTIKKIDEIEAHMSKQWWRGKQDEEAAQGGNPPPGAELNLAAGKSVPLTYETTQSSALNLDEDSAQSVDYESTQMGLPMSDEPALVDRNSFVVSDLFSIDLVDSPADPDLEEAAIRFANGDDVGAEAGLLAALQADTVTADSASGWAAALFDFYRATGQQASFDRVAIDYALRFGRSAPAWFSTPDLLGRKKPQASSSLAHATDHNWQTDWECAPELDFDALQVLLDGESYATGTWRMNWSRLESITPQAGKALAGLFAQWCSKPVKLYFLGAEALEKTLRLMTPSGQKQIETFWWQLRLDALRILRLQDEFELAALDFCVTYEVSPPPWKDARCELVQDMTHATAARTVPSDLQATSVMDLTPHPAPAVVVELSGEVLGDAVDALDEMQSGLKGSDRLVISCARLIRVDFSAAGSILNWVAVRQSEGCRVQFRDVPRLVAAFFNVIGINEHARVVLRTS